MSTLHCDSCERELGNYLYGEGGIEKIAHIFGTFKASRIPDIVCNDCWNQGYTSKNPRKNRDQLRQKVEKL